MSDVTTGSLRAEERQRLACQAALGVTAELGLTAQRPVVLKDWNNTIVRLVPSALVAKVGTSHFCDTSVESLEREVAVSAHLAARGAPVIRPAARVPPGPHHWQGLSLTLWEYVEPIPGAELDPAEMTAAMQTVHDALSDFDGSLPYFALELDDARTLLQAHRSPSLEASDRQFLLSVGSELEAALAPLAATCIPLHGSPHGANWLLSGRGPLLLDFETACVGPVEWDLAALEDEALVFFPDADDESISILRRMRSVCVAAKRAVAPERAPELREAVDVHLKLLRGSDWTRDRPPVAVRPQTLAPVGDNGRPPAGAGPWRGDDRRRSRAGPNSARRSRRPVPSRRPRGRSAAVDAGVASAVDQPG